MCRKTINTLKCTIIQYVLNMMTSNLVGGAQQYSKTFLVGSLILKLEFVDARMEKLLEPDSACY